MSFNLSGQSQNTDKICDKYILSYHKEEIVEVLRNPQTDKHFAIDIDFVALFEYEPSLGNSLLREPEQALSQWDSSLLRVQTTLLKQLDEKNLQIKPHVHCRIHGLPLCPDLHKNIFPRNDDTNKFLQLSGTVVRMTATKMLEYQRNYICTKCKYSMLVKANYEQKYNIVPPKKCTNPEGCNGMNIIASGDLDAESCKDYQEIKMQESAVKIEVGSMPSSMWVTLEDDLVDCCKPGDNVTVCGIVKRRWHPAAVGKRMDIQLVFKANHIQVNNANSSSMLVTPEMKAMFDGFWETYSGNPLAARDIILKSVCPQIFGLYLVKLAIAVVLAGGSQVSDTSGTGVRFRSEPHLLLVGDPGTGKSHLLRFASKIIPRSVLTTGVGSTAAGLTVTAVMEDGEWQLEAGALVLSDGGICCIDEFNSMKEHDRTSIHEAMEQQTISVAKASIVCKLSTKCSILAATNPKGNIDPSQPLNMNIALASPLLSRFDLILLLRDTINEQWDSLVCDYILNTQNNSCSKLADNIFWTVETLQGYFAIIKKLNPELTPESTRILSGYYQAQRRKNVRNKARTTVRLLDSLVRLSQGHARLMYHQKVEVMDAVIAVVLAETAMDSETSLFDLRFDAQSDFPLCATKSYKGLVEIILKRLQLNDLLDAEMVDIDERMSSTADDDTSARPAVKILAEDEVKSKYFQSAGGKMGDSDVEKSAHNKSKRDTDNKSKKRKLGSTDNFDENCQKFKTKKSKNDIIDDLGILNLIPSVNDDFQLSDFDSNADIIDSYLDIEHDKVADNNRDDSCNVLPNIDDETPKKQQQISAGSTETDTTEIKSTISCQQNQKSKNARLFLDKFKFKPQDKDVFANNNTSDLGDSVKSSSSTFEVQGPQRGNNIVNSVSKSNINCDMVNPSTSSIFESQQDEVDNLDLSF